MATARPRPEIEAGDLPAEESEQERERDLVDHRRRDQEREGDAERHARLHEADEQRHRRAGTERRDDAERGRQDVAHALGAAGEQRPRAFGREVGIDHPHDEHDAGEQQQHLRGVVEEELERAAEVAVPIHGQQRRQHLRQRRQRLKSDEPHRGRDQQEQPGPVVGEREDGVHATRPMARCGRPANAARRFLTSRSLSGGTPPPTSASSIDRAHLGKRRQPIVHPRPLAAGLDPAPVTQQGEVARNARLKLFERCDELADANFTFDRQQRQHAAPGGITDQIDVRIHVCNIARTLYIEL